MVSYIAKFVDGHLLNCIGNDGSYTELGRNNRDKTGYIYTGYWSLARTYFVIGALEDSRGRTEWFYKTIDNVESSTDIAESRHEEFERLRHGELFSRTNRIAGKEISDKIKRVLEFSS
ncbi:MAG: hypothetical protein AABX19_00845 [Nanoarchaeota archaeon]